MLDSTVQRVAGDLEGPGGVTGCELAQSGPDLACAEVPERPGADDLQYRLQQALIQHAGPLRPSIQPLPEPVLHRIADRIAHRRSDPGLKLLMQRLELVPDVLLGAAVDLPADPLALGRVAERDGPHVPVLGRREVDRVLAVPSALGAGLRPVQEPNSLPPHLAPRTSLASLTFRPDRTQYRPETNLTTQRDGRIRENARRPAVLLAGRCMDLT